MKLGALKVQPVSVVGVSVGFKKFERALWRATNTCSSFAAMKACSIAIGLAAAAVVVSGQSGVAANVIFSANVTKDDGNNGGGGGGPTDPDPNLYACIIEIQQSGTFGMNLAGDTLDSELAGGVPSVIRVTSVQLLTTPTSGFDLTFDAPGSFSSAPAGGSINTTFSTRFAGTNVSSGVNFPLQSGSTVVTLPDSGVSVTQITGHLRAFKSDGPFPEGAYSSEAVLRCE